MKKLVTRLTAFLALVLSGCGIGYNQTLFVTSSNVGLNVDTKPPVAEISIGRREGVIPPTFEEGKVPPVYSSIGVHASGFLPLATDISGLFAGGDASDIVSTPSGEDSSVDNHCLTRRPTNMSGDGDKAGDVKPMFFGTDTSYGFKIAWTGTAGPYPDSVKLGYNRTEFALAPVILSDDISDCLGPDKSNPHGYVARARMPSFLASINTKLTAAGLAGGTAATATSPVSGNPTAGGGSSFDYTQFFATGASAENLARNSAVKKLYQTEGARDAEALLNYVRRFSQCVAAPDGSFDAKRLGAALDRAAVDKAITSDDVTFLKSAKSTVQLQDLITGGAQDTGPKLAAYVLLHKDLCSRTS